MELRKGKEEKEKGKDRGREGKPEEKDEKKKPGFVAKAVLAAGIMVAAAAGCTERTVNNYYCPDGEARDTVEDVAEDSATEPDVPEEVADMIEDTVPEIIDVVEEDAEPEAIDVIEEDVTEEEVECVADLAPVTCDSSSPAAEGVITTTSGLEIGNITMFLVHVDETSHPISASVSFVDSCGNIIEMDHIEEGSTTGATVAGAVYEITTNRISGYMWADVSVTVNCGDTYCLVSSGILNIGEIMPYPTGGDELRLDDLDLGHSEGPAALISILDASGYLLHVDSLMEGEFTDFADYRVLATDIGAGYGFIARWARFEISQPCD